MLFKYLSVSQSSSKLLLCMIKSNSRAGIHKLLFTPSDDHIWRISKPHHVKKVIFNWPMLAFFIWGMIFYLQISLSVLLSFNLKEVWFEVTNALVSGQFRRSSSNFVWSMQIDFSILYTPSLIQCLVQAWAVPGCLEMVM